VVTGYASLPRGVCGFVVQDPGADGVEALNSPLKNACGLRACHPGRSPRRATCVESMDSTPFALLDLDPAATLSATQPFFNGLLTCRSLRGSAARVAMVFQHLAAGGGFNGLLAGALVRIVVLRGRVQWISAD
jgi:hypothetical protein